jgi:hypothetical protein
MIHILSCKAHEDDRMGEVMPDKDKNIARRWQTDWTGLIVMFRY